MLCIPFRGRFHRDCRLTAIRRSAGKRLSRISTVQQRHCRIELKRDRGAADREQVSPGRLVPSRPTPERPASGALAMREPCRHPGRPGMGCACRRQSPRRAGRPGDTPVERLGSGGTSRRCPATGAGGQGRAARGGRQGEGGLGRLSATYAAHGGILDGEEQNESPKIGGTEV